MKITRRILCVALAIISILMLCIVAGVVCDKKAQSEIKEKEYRVVFNNCYAYERLNTEYISSEHNGGASFFTKENSDGTVIEVDGYKHIHYAVFNETDELFCAAISDERKRFLQQNLHYTVKPLRLRYNRQPPNLYTHIILRVKLPLPFWKPLHSDRLFSAKTFFFRLKLRHKKARPSH